MGGRLPLGLYGIDIEDLLCSPGSADSRQQAEAALKATSDVADVQTRFAHAEALAVARTVRWLQARLGESSSPEEITRLAADSHTMTLNAVALAAVVSPARAGVLVDLLVRAHGKRLVSEGYAREQLRLGMEGWLRARVLFEGAGGGVWNTSTAANRSAQ